MRQKYLCGQDADECVPYHHWTIVEAICYPSAGGTWKIPRPAFFEGNAYFCVAEELS